MFITDLEDTKYNAVASAINIDMCVQILVVSDGDCFVLVALVPIQNEKIRRVNIARYPNENEAIAAYRDLMQKIDEEKGVWSPLDMLNPIKNRF